MSADQCAKVHLLCMALYVWKAAFWPHNMDEVKIRNLWRSVSRCQKQELSWEVWFQGHTRGHILTFSLCQSFLLCSLLFLPVRFSRYGICHMSLCLLYQPAFCLAYWRLSITTSWVDSVFGEVLFLWAQSAQFIWCVSWAYSLWKSYLFKMQGTQCYWLYDSATWSGTWKDLRCQLVSVMVWKWL